MRESCTPLPAAVVTAPTRMLWLTNLSCVSKLSIFKGKEWPILFLPAGPCH